MFRSGESREQMKMDWEDEFMKKNDELRALKKRFNEKDSELKKLQARTRRLESDLHKADGNSGHVIRVGGGSNSVRDRIEEVNYIDVLSHENTKLRAKLRALTAKEREREKSTKSSSNSSKKRPSSAKLQHQSHTTSDPKKNIEWVTVENPSETQPADENIKKFLSKDRSSPNSGAAINPVVQVNQIPPHEELLLPFHPSSFLPSPPSADLEAQLRHTKWKLKQMEIKFENLQNKVAETEHVLQHFQEKSQTLSEKCQVMWTIFTPFATFLTY